MDNTDTNFFDRIYEKLINKKECYRKLVLSKLLTDVDSAISTGVSKTGHVSYPSITLPPKPRLSIIPPHPGVKEIKVTITSRYLQELEEAGLIKGFWEKRTNGISLSHSYNQKTHILTIRKYP
jgi:hypothetical protein